MNYTGLPYMHLRNIIAESYRSTSNMQEDKGIRTIRYFFAAVFLCILIGTIAVLCVVLIPYNASSDDVYRIVHEINENGDIIWKEAQSDAVKLVIKSNIRSKRTDSMQNKMACAQVEDSIDILENKSTESVKCFEIYSARGGSEQCDDENDLIVEDCILMQAPSNYFSSNEVHWYGGAELYTQKWPINNISKEIFNVYLSTDLPWRYGNVLERYWLSSSGVAIYVYPEVPLSVQVTATESICLQANYNVTQYFGAAYTWSRNSSASDITTKLKYAVCFSEIALATHTAMLKLTKDSDQGFIDRPSQLPDLKMIQDPIWSTWARFKSRINQSIVEQFANEIIEHNFTNSQLEIDDGYELNYGDFTFDEEKFPNPVGMIESLNEMGFRVTTWVTPFINTGSINYITGRRNGYFIAKSPEDSTPDLITWWNGIGAVVDFSNPDAAMWYENVLADVKEKYGLDSFKFDAGETNYIPANGYTYNSMPNPGEYTTLYAESAYKVGGNMVEMRSAWKTQSYPIFTRMMDKGSRWGSFKGLQTLIPTALVFGIIGYPFVLPDMVGGNAYGNLKPDKELYIRWLEITAFLPVLQFSISPWDYDEEVTEIANRYVDYHRTVVYDELVKTIDNYVSAKDVFSPVSPIWFLANESEAAAFSCSDEFLVGSRYLVAPILWQGSRGRDIYLPGGPVPNRPIRWRDMLKNEIVNGGQWIISYRIELHEISWWERIID